MLEKLLSYLRTKYSDHSDIAEYQLGIHADSLEFFVNGDYSSLDSDDGLNSLLFNLRECLISNKGVPMNSNVKINATVIRIPQLSSTHVGALCQEKMLWHPNVYSSVRNAIAIPQYIGKLEDCCILTALNLGRRYNAELRANLGNSTMKEESELWKKLKSLNYSEEDRRSRNAKIALMNDTLQWCQNDLQIEPQDYSNCALEDLTDIVEKMDINLIVYDRCLGYRRVFAHPAIYDPTKENIYILLLPGRDDSLRHAAIIKNTISFFADRKAIDCPFCRQSYSRQYFQFHKCTRAKACQLCRRIEAKNNHYIDYNLFRERCQGKRKKLVQLQCDKCDQVAYDSACFDIHKKVCDVLLDFCHECKSLYRRKLGYTHKCGDKFCRTCVTHYNIRKDGRHRCHMSRPRIQNNFDRIAVWDTETCVKYVQWDERSKTEEVHFVNAVGLSWESDEFGVFNEIYFYDDELNHEDDSVLKEHAYEYSYFPEGNWQPEVKFASKRTKLKKKDPYSASLEECEENENGETSADIGSSFICSEAKEVEDYSDDESILCDDESLLCDEEDMGNIHMDMKRILEEQDARFQMSSALEKFLNYILQPEFAHFTFLAHNGSR